MNLKDKVGTFKVIDSFIIRRKNEFYLIGEIVDGELSVGNYINITLNPSLFLSAKIDRVEDVEISNDDNIYKLIIVDSSKQDNEGFSWSDFLFAQNVGSENIYITLTGTD